MNFFPATKRVQFPVCGSGSKEDHTIRNIILLGLFVVFLIWLSNTPAKENDYPIPDTAPVLGGV